jgi:hypothetical protein
MAQAEVEAAWQAEFKRIDATEVRGQRFVGRVKPGGSKRSMPTTISGGPSLALSPL